MNTYERDALLTKAHLAYLALRGRYKRLRNTCEIDAWAYESRVQSIREARDLRKAAIIREFERQEREAFMKFNMRFRIKDVQNLAPGVYTVQLVDVKTENVRGGQIVTFSMVQK